MQVVDADYDRFAQEVKHSLSTGNAILISTIDPETGREINGFLIPSRSRLYSSVVEALVRVEEY